MTVTEELRSMTATKGLVEAAAQREIEATNSLGPMRTHVPGGERSRFGIFACFRTPLG